ncbi:MAG: aminopeptidase P family protein [Rhodobacteraceae bacterium]|nr:aminopeptidase P family protein [Paracoccaceae bacterium]
MLQSFVSTTRPADGPPRLALLRDALRAQGLSGFVVPRADAHQGETVAPRDERLAWLTGFTGSAGICVALLDRAALFVDGRYTLQGRSQTDAAAFEVLSWPRTRPARWIAEGLAEGGRVAFDPWLHTPAQIAEMRAELEPRGIALVASANLVDAIWNDQPAPPGAPLRPYPVALAGEASADKRARIGQALAEAGQSAAVLTLPDSIAWLLNIRGGDVARIPVAHAFAIIHDSGEVDLFIDPAKLDENAGAHLGAGVRIRGTEAFGPGLDTLRGVVRLDRTTAPVWVENRLEAAGVEMADTPDPCLLPKACKNATELAGTRAAHRRDGAAMAAFLHWLDSQRPESLTEIDVVRALEGFRRTSDALRDISFETICGAGPNGAIVHYRVTEDSNRQLATGEVLLVDSGGQYEDGTTDITRTIALGPTDHDAQEAFTRVLRGMIAISTARFPKGLAGRDLDALARAALWRAGQDYDHGTGHGVGHYLGVHEGPQRLARSGEVALQPGMILSNEPGYYREGAFGIRIENLIAVRKAPDLPGGDAREMLDFETLTLAPIDRRMILAEMLHPDERAWLDAYHAHVLKEVGPLCAPEVLAWLKDACAPM